MSDSTLPSWWDKESSHKRKQINARSKKQESKRAEQIGGRVQPGSGCSSNAPQDVRSDEYMEQLKFTDSASYRLTVKEWLQLSADSDRFGRSPRMVIDFEKHNLRLVITQEEM
jgi:hypothetical protein